MSLALRVDHLSADALPTRRTPTAEYRQTRAITEVVLPTCPAGRSEYGRAQAGRLHSAPHFPQGGNVTGEAGRVVVIRGSSGIGEATAKLFAARGAEVVITGRDESKLGRAQAACGASRAEVVDGTVPAALNAFFAKLGPFDHLVLSLSGGKGAGAFGQLELGGLRAAFEAKFWAYVQILQAALPTLRASATLVSAGSARAALAGTSGLAAINGALEAMVAPLAAELAPIRVNAVSPGVIDTPWWDAMPETAKHQFMGQAARSLPVGRVGRPEDVAEAIVMLAGNGFITGTVVEVDGGGHLARG